MLGQNRLLTGRPTSAQHDISDSIDAIMITANEPKRGLKEAEIRAADELDSGNEFVEYFVKRPYLSALAITFVTVGFAALYYIKKVRI